MIKFEQFLKLSKKYNLIPVYDELIVDTETPVSLYRKISNMNDYSFLLESASSGEKLKTGRYSFIGIKPEKIIKNNKNCIEISNNKGEIIKKEKSKNISKFIRDFLKKYQVYQIEGLPPFSGGLVGYFGYEMIDEWEDIYHQDENKYIKKSDIPSVLLVVAKLILVYDHLNNTVKIINNIYLKNGIGKKEKKKKYNDSKKKINKIINLIRNKDYDKKIYKPGKITTNNLKSNTEKHEFEEIVKKAKDHIKKGDIFQIVLSQKFSVKTEQHPFDIYRALRVSNPSPYMFYLNFPEIKLIGSSPEILVQVQNKKVISRPLAGTRKRGETRSLDLELEKDLKNDKKEKAEHIMLVDLGRNDLGKVCKYNSIKVTELMGIEYYSRVMHLVSQVEGEIKDNLTGIDVLKATFPAGTVSGAPKIRAMELINKLEKEARGIYAGAVGYIDFRGNIDTCIAIRTFTYRKGVLSAQVGAGIVVDSDPEKEFKETLNKGKALFEAIEITRKEAPYGLSY